MRKIENFAQISDLLNAQLKRGVITNNFLRGDDYTREIANGLYIHETGGALMLFRERGDHLVMTFYLHPNAVLSLPETDRSGRRCRRRACDRAGHGRRRGGESTQPHRAVPGRWRKCP